MDEVEISVGEWRTVSLVGNLPEAYTLYVEHALLCDEFDIKGSQGRFWFLGVGRNDHTWPCVVIAQRFETERWSGFNPGAHIVPNTAILFAGAGTRLLAYDLRKPTQKWEDYVEVGFWSWKQHGDIVVMAAELEMSAWSAEGAKLWSASVEPPWDYTIVGENVHLDIMGKKSVFGLVSGPSTATRG